MDASKLVRFSLIETDMMEDLEIPIGENIDSESLIRESLDLCNRAKLSKEEKEEIIRRAIKVLGYRRIVKKYLVGDPNSLFKEIFGNPPIGKIDVEAGSYHLIITSTANLDFEDELNHNVAIGYIHKGSKKIKIPELCGLIEIRVKDRSMVAHRIIEMLSGKEIDINAHEREHVRYYMVVKQDSPLMHWDQFQYPYIELYEQLLAFFEDRILGEFSASLIGDPFLSEWTGMPTLQRGEELTFHALKEYREQSDPDYRPEIERAEAQYVDFFINLKHRRKTLVYCLEEMKRYIPKRNLAFILTNSNLTEFTENSQDITDAYKTVMSES